MQSAQSVLNQKLKLTFIAQSVLNFHTALIAQQSAYYCMMHLHHCTVQTNCTHGELTSLHSAQFTLNTNCTQRHCRWFRSTATPSSCYSPDAKTSAYKLPQIATNATNGELGLLLTQHACIVVYILTAKSPTPELSQIICLDKKTAFELPPIGTNDNQPMMTIV